MMSNKKILMLVGDYVEDYEVMVPFQALQMLGYTVHAVCPDKEQGDYVRTAVHDFDGAQTYSEKPGHNFALNYSFDKVNPDDYDGLLIPGGRAPEYLGLNEQVLAIIRKINQAKKPIAAVCHGPQLLAAAGIIQGHKISAYPACRAEVLLAQADYADIALDAAHVSGHIVTAPAWPAHPEWLAAFVKLLGAKITL